MGIFKAYDIRGTVPDQLNPGLAFRIGWAFARLLAEDTPQPRIVVGIDARPTGPALAAAFLDGLAAGGAVGEFAGPCTTPMLYWVVAARQPVADGGAMITASHNPARYNGIKFCRKDAVPVAWDTGIAEIEQLCAQAPQPPAAFVSRAQLALYDPVATDTQAPLGFAPGLFAGYVEHLRRFVRRLPEQLAVVVDSANGMGGAYLGFLRSLGLKLKAMNSALDGTFPNHEANPSKLENLEPLCEAVKAAGARLGIAFDGDADRAVFVDETGAPVGQDMITALLGQEYLRRHKGAAVLYDLRSSRAVPETIEAAGGRPIRERVGHSYMKATMRKVGCVFGGELAGHYYYKENFYADSAIITVLEVLNAMGRTGEPLSALVRPVRKYAQTGEVNFRIEDKEAVFAAVRERFKDGQVDTLDGITVQYPGWWFNLRASNTEPLVRLNLEAPTPRELREKFELLAPLLGKPAE